MINVLFTAFMLTALPDDTIPHTHEKTDTLKEVEVLAPESVSGLEDAIRQSLKKMGIDPRTPSVSDVINKISTGLTDKIMHPFAIKERKKTGKKAQAR